MFDDYKKIRGSIWQSNINSWLGSLFLISVALWAALIMMHFVWNTNPIANTFTAAIVHETQLPN
ncbi:MAG TPA: hypothetical protein VHD31_01725 [Candidatus Paceibacterota bacterium]|nr:hypothetical protein [Candidatus Paceibacterota bacterium]